MVSTLLKHSIAQQALWRTPKRANAFLSFLKALGFLFHHHNTLQNVLTAVISRIPRLPPVAGKNKAIHEAGWPARHIIHAGRASR
jgi:hypothetical protein